MAHIARLIMIEDIKNIPDNLIPFVIFKAGMDGYTIVGNEKVAILQVDNIKSYYPIFLNGINTLEKVENELKNMDTEIDSEARNELKRLMK